MNKNIVLRFISLQGGMCGTTNISLLLLLLTTFHVAVRGGLNNDYRLRPWIKQVFTANHINQWASGPSSKNSMRTKVLTPMSSAFCTSSQHVVKPFPLSQTGHSYSSYCNSFHIINRKCARISIMNSSQGYYWKNKASACTRLHAKRDLEQDVAVDDYLDSAMSNLVNFSNDDANGIEIKDQPSVVYNDEISIAVNDSPTTISPQFQPILILCFLVTLLSALDRVAMSIAILPLASEFHYTETIKGQIASAVSYGYAAAILPIGLATSVASPKALMLVGVGLWSLATLGTPWMAGLTIPGGDTATAMILLPLLVIRAIMGAAEAVSRK